MTPRIRNGQSTLEYAIILAVVVGVIVAAGMIFQPNLAATYNTLQPKQKDRGILIRIKMGYKKIALRARNGQSFIEYTMLIIIVSAALIAMTTYIVRAMNARLGQ